MDPHSRRSQFNHRAPKAGPVSRTVEPISTPKAEPSKMPPRKTSSSAKASSTASANLLIRRPIATNSRVKQDEIFKRDMYLSFVTNALQQKTNGASDTFDELVAQFNMFSSSQQQQEQIDTAQIRLWLLALSHVVSRSRERMPPSSTVKSYTVFIGMLLSARPEYLSLVLAKIAHGFTYQSGLQVLDASLPSTSSSPLTRRVIYDRLHYLLRHILGLVPTLTSTLQPLLVRHFPHKRQNQVAQTTYIRNLLRVSTYCPELADKILATIVDRAIQIDVEIQIELEEIEEEGSTDEQDVFEIDPFDIVLGQEPDSDDSDFDSDDGDEDAFSDLSSEADLDDLDSKRQVDLPTNVKHIQEMVKKLDAILLLLFEHFERTKTLTGRITTSYPKSPLELPPLPPVDSNFLDFGPPYTQSLSLGPPPITASAILASQSSSTNNNSSEDSAKPSNRSPLRSQFHSLLSIFDRTILRTFKSRYTQFLVFWYASLDPEFADIFQGMLVDRALMPSSAGGPAAHFAPSNPSANGDDNNDSSSNEQAHMMTPELTRAAAASYIGSFVSRATFVDREGARRVVGVLCDYLRTHLEGVEAELRAALGFGTASSASSGGGSANAAATISAILASGQHTVFYAIVQAVFLIFCFRWRDLVADDEDEDELDLELDFDLATGARGGRVGKNGAGGAPGGGSRVKEKWMPELAVLKRAVSSILNPLKVCSANVVMQFARVAQATDFIYCYTILETNKRADMTFSSSSISTSMTASSRRESLSSSMALLQSKVLCEPANAELNTFFPFDPYRLPKSNAFIQGVYREWASVAIDDDEDEEEDEDEEDELKEGDAADEGEVGADKKGAYSGYLDIPRDSAIRKNEDDGGLGESLGAMSISPIRMSISVDMRR
ncbi:RNA polymerase I-specific transcription initiation factor RRN3 [Flammula alnicola]|nr:RNA polymerase I-specific transcription initiation factor RRN3 [Flammula alnicola]